MKHLIHNLRRRVLQFALTRSLGVLPRGDISKLVIVTLLHVFLALLDLVGVGIIGILGALAVTGVQSVKPGGIVNSVLELLHLQSYSLQFQAGCLALLATFFLISRTVLSIIATRRMLFFLSRRGAVISANLVSKLLTQSLSGVRSRSPQETLYGVTTGVTSITLGVIGTAIGIFSDLSLLILMGIALLLTDTLIAVTAFAFFSLLGLALYRTMSVKAQELGLLNSKLNVVGNQKIIEAIESFRETVVHNRRKYYADEIKDMRLKLSDVLAEIQFMPSVSKYVIESGMVVGALIIAGTQFAIRDAKHAVAALAVFMASATRIAPAIMRLQQNLIQMRGSIGAAIPTLALIDQLKNSEVISDSYSMPDFNYHGFTPDLLLDDVTFTFPGDLTPTLKQVSLRIPSGTSLALVGPSGSGKTTLVDVLLGILPPDSGTITISGLNPLGAIEKWPGSISYVPQSVSIVRGSIRMNVGMGYPAEFISDSAAWEALELAQLSEFVKNLPNQLDTHIGDGALTLSGGQRQRLGIARALFTMPKLLVLDEATSALDGQAESDFSHAITSLSGKVTVIMIAHRLSTARNVDRVAYISNGRLMALGTIDEVRAQVPDFDKQAELMGL